MTNQELQDALAKLPPDMPVRHFLDHEGYWEDIYAADLEKGDEDDPDIRFVGII